MSDKYITRTTRISVIPEGEPLFSEKATNIEICDEAAGEFVEVTQQSMRTDCKAQTIQVDSKEWPTLKSAIERMIKECR